MKTLPQIISVKGFSLDQELASYETKAPQPPVEPIKYIRGPYVPPQNDFDPELAHLEELTAAFSGQVDRTRQMASHVRAEDLNHLLNSGRHPEDNELVDPMYEGFLDDDLS